MMENIELLKNYTELNNSFKKKLIFHIGVQAGFFSEYNNMILIMLYCLKNKIKFILCSDDANFSYERGWTDYFLPFCTEVPSEFHHEYNLRTDQIQELNLNLLNKLQIRYFKYKYGIDYLTQDIFLPHVRNHLDKFNVDKYYIPELEIDGDLNHALKVLINLTWRFNESTNNYIEQRKTQLLLNKPYVGFHIRDGDKSTEVNIIDPCEYMEKAQKMTDIKDAFVLTDNYNVIEKLHNNYSCWTISTFCGINERGYIHNEFQQTTKENIREGHLSLFSSIEILAQSDLFIGTFSSNPGMYLAIRKPLGQCYSADNEEWRMR